MKRTFFTEQQEDNAKAFDPKRDKFEPGFVVSKFVSVFFFTLFLIDGGIVLLTLAYAPVMMGKNEFWITLGMIPVLTGVIGIFHFEFMVKKLSVCLKIIGEMFKNTHRNCR